MAENPTPRRTPPPNESEGQRINRELAEAAQEAEARHADEMPKEREGGYFIVDGEAVDANGKPIADKK